MHQYFNHVEADILVERVEDDYGQSIVVPCSVNQQQFA